jgi:hypothetical protein
MVLLKQAADAKTFTLPLQKTARSFVSDLL